MRSRATLVLGAVGALMLVLSASSGCDKKQGLRITGWEPKAGPYTGGGTVNIKGTGFQEGGAMGVKVYFGDKEGKVLGFIGGNELKVETPAGEIGTTVDILIQFDDAKSLTIEKAYTYQDDTQKGFDVDALTEGKAAVPAAPTPAPGVGSSRVDLQACKLEYSIVSPK